MSWNLNGDVSLGKNPITALEENDVIHRFV
jgi:hypothetical protein